MSMMQIITIALLIASVSNMAPMIPGGFVETRDFGAYPSVVLAAFNVFLTILGLGSLALVWDVAWNNAGFELSMMAGIAYAAVYIADLGLIFPVTPSPMSPLLARLEALGAALGGALATSGCVAVLTHPSKQTASQSLPLYAQITLVVVGIAIVVFATRAAMRRK